MSRTNPKLPDIRTVEVGFLQSKSGHSILTVNPDTPVADVMDAAGELLDGIYSLLRTLSDSGEGEADGFQLHALSVLANTASNMIAACSRALDKNQEAGNEHG